MAEAAALRYAVILRRPDDYRFQDLAAVLARHHQVPVDDMMPVARSAWGLAALDQTEAAAQPLADALTAGGFPALALPQNLVEELPPAVHVVKVDLAAGAAVFHEASGATHLVPGPRAALIAAAIVKQDVTQVIKTQKDIGLGQKAVQIGLLMATGLPIRTAGMRKEVEKTLTSSELFGTLDLCLSSPPGRLRLQAHDFDYSCLGARKAFDALSNFRLLVRELAARWPDAGRNRGARVILAGAPPREMGHAASADLERESRWLLTLRTLDRPA